MEIGCASFRRSVRASVALMFRTCHGMARLTVVLLTCVVTARRIVALAMAAVAGTWPFRPGAAIIATHHSLLVYLLRQGLTYCRRLR